MGEHLARQPAPVSWANDDQQWHWPRTPSYSLSFSNRNWTGGNEGPYIFIVDPQSSRETDRANKWYGGWIPTTTTDDDDDDGDDGEDDQMPKLAHLIMADII